jgi:hypothetical protein
MPEHKPTDTQTGKSGKIITAANTIRAISTVIVLGMPLIAGAAAITGCGIYKIRPLHNSSFPVFPSL